MLTNQQNYLPLKLFLGSLCFYDFTQYFGSNLPRVCLQRPRSEHLTTSKLRNTNYNRYIFSIAVMCSCAIITVREVLGFSSVDMSFMWIVLKSHAISSRSLVPITMSASVISKRNWNYLCQMFLCLLVIRMIVRGNPNGCIVIIFSLSAIVFNETSKLLNHTAVCDANKCNTAVKLLFLFLFGSV